MDSIKLSRDAMVGTHLIGYFEANYTQLVKMFGLPNCYGDGYKVSTEWEFTFKGQPFTLYDYKVTNLYDSDAMTVEQFRAMDSYAWHIGGTSVEYLQEFIETLKARLVDGDASNDGTKNATPF